MNWIIIALVACFAEAGRAIVIKKHPDINPHILVFNTRLIAFVIILSLLPFNSLNVLQDNIPEFIIALIVTVFFTLIATILKLRVIMVEEISRTSPLLALTPLFIIPWSIIILGESPSPLALIGILVVIGGAIVIKSNYDKDSKKLSWNSIYLILIILILYGLTTVVDKVGIRNSNAYTYTFIWTLCSLLSSSYVLITNKPREIFKETLSKFNLFQGSLWAIAFLGQQFAVGLSMHIPMNTGYIKSIMYVGILFSVIVGGRIFKEKNLLLKLSGAVTIISGNIIILYYLIN